MTLFQGDSPLFSRGFAIAIEGICHCFIGDLPLFFMKNCHFGICYCCFSGMRENESDCDLHSELSHW